MTALIKKLYASDVVRYVFFGGCTTLVNLVSFFFFCARQEFKEILQM